MALQGLQGLQGDAQGRVDIPLAQAAGDFSVVFSSYQLTNPSGAGIGIGLRGATNNFIANFSGGTLKARVGNATSAAYSGNSGDSVKLELKRVGSTVTIVADDDDKVTFSTNSTFKLDSFLSYSSGAFGGDMLLSGTCNMTGFDNPSSSGAAVARRYNFEGSGTTLVDELGGQNGTLTDFTTGGFTSIANSNPTPSAGPDQSNISHGGTVTLDGSGSTDSDGTIATYAWTQTAGTTVTLSDASIVNPTFTAPSGGAETLVFQLVVTDNEGATDSDTVSIGIQTQVSEGGLDIILLGGQSGMVGRRGPIDSVLDATDDRIMQYGTTRKTLELAQDPLDHHDETPNTIGLGLSLAKAYADRHLTAGRKVLLVTVADGGTSFRSGFWRTGGTGYTNAIARANEAMELGDGVNRFVMTAWHQGESDKDATEAQHATDLDALIAGFRSSITGAADAPFIVGEIPTASTYYGSGVAAALLDTFNRVSNTAFVTTDDLPLSSDSLHFGAASLRTIGRRYESQFSFPTDPNQSTANISVVGIPNSSFVTNFCHASTGVQIAQFTLSYANGSASQALEVASGTAFKFYVDDSATNPANFTGDYGVTV